MPPGRALAPVAPLGRVPQAWRRMFNRLVVRAVWHWQGLLLWLVRHPELRGLPYPWPSVETTEAYAAQPRGRDVSAAVLALLVEFRNKQGFADAFLENDLVNQALMIAKSKVGTLGRVKARAKAESLSLRPTPPSGATYNATACQLLGPRGGLPRSKEDLMKLAKAYGINAEGKTVDQLKTLIRPLVATGARLYEEPEPAAASSSVASGRPPATGSSGSAHDTVSSEELHGAIMAALRRVYGEAPPDLLRAMTAEAFHHVQAARNEQQLLRERLGPYLEQDDEDMDDLVSVTSGWVAPSMAPSMTSTAAPSRR